MFSESEEQHVWFQTRTHFHIKLVTKYCNKIADAFPSFEALRARGPLHDASKFCVPEYEPYVQITWGYKQKDTGREFVPSEELKNSMNEATLHHVLTNSHHPEYHNPRKTELLNRENRDKPPAQIIDATGMPDLDIAEMCADWLAMSEEKKTNTAKQWAERNIGVRWHFTQEQIALIYGLLEVGEGKS